LSTRGKPLLGACNYPDQHLAPFAFSRYFSPMKLLFLHGAPAAGKLTVAKALLQLVPGRLFDNHAAIDPALTLFEFGAPGFWELVHSVRYAALEAAAAQGVPLVVTTFCYAEPEDRAQFEHIDEIMRRHGGALLPVFLRCSREELARRVGNPDRVERRKLTSAPVLMRDLDIYDFAPVPRPDCLELDTGTRPPEATAQEIVRHFGLDA
jgi:chloramphenicol 3-O-phosphotransferase